MCDKYVFIHDVLTKMKHQFKWYIVMTAVENPPVYHSRNFKTSLVENMWCIRIIRVRNAGTNSGDSQRIDAMHTTYSDFRSGGIGAMKALLNSSTCVLHMIHHHQKIHTKILYIL